MASKTVVQQPQRPFGDLSDEQVAMVLEQIATTANSLRRFVAQAHADAASTPHANALDVATMLTERIGALADFACGEDVVGTVGDWMLGPLFRDVKEVTHG